MWPSIQDDGGYQSASSLWIVERGVGVVVKWSCGVIERCVNISVSQHDARYFLRTIRGAGLGVEDGK